MNKLIKEVINRISECNMLMTIDCFGDLIDDIIFQNERSAIFIDNKKKKMYLLFSCSIDSQKRLEKILLITELLAVLDDLVKKRLIYVQFEENVEDLIFFYEGKQLFNADQIPGRYILSQDVYLQIKEDEVALIRNKKEFMNSIPINDNIALPLLNYLCARIMPTRALKEYIKNGFITNEEKYTKRGLRYSLLSMIIAVFVAALSPFFSVVISNRKGVTTINESQIDYLINNCRTNYVNEDNTFICGEERTDSMIITK